ncbi:MAG: hypothetical protein ACKVWR_22290 [Acidimicrobiales bacterium]
MTSQLILIDNLRTDGAHLDGAGEGRVARRSAPDWRLDDKTREVGRAGIARARAALAAARARPPAPGELTPEVAGGAAEEQSAA